MNEEQAKKLREPFPEAVIGKLPKVNCKACVEANKARFGTTCDRHQKQKCAVCDNYMTTAHIHLDYVGHAATTDRLLQVDPEWTWEFVDHLPINAAGLWIKLTIGGVSRYGFGDGKNPKEMIGDAIRNAAMRFGVALDLWAKEDLHASDEHAGPGDQGNPRATGSGPATYGDLQQVIELLAATLTHGSYPKPWVDEKLPNLAALRRMATAGEEISADQRDHMLTILLHNEEVAV